MNLNRLIEKIRYKILTEIKPYVNERCSNYIQNAPQWHIAYILLNMRVPNTELTIEEKAELFSFISDNYKLIDDLIEQGKVGAALSKVSKLARVAKGGLKRVGTVAKKVATYDIGKKAGEVAKVYTPTFTKWGRRAKWGAIAGVSLLVGPTILRKAKGVYDEIFGKMAQQCADAPEGKEECLKRAKLRAIDAQISSIRSSIVQCNQAKDVEKCRKTLGDTINKLVQKKNEIVAKR